ncbi:holo-ACP synthase [Candidatus Poribacteria bacterium]|nr:holo-ACP synthase [Candidatus Poribacteria bacterium]
MILEIGVDLVEVERIRDISLKWGDKFEKRVFTPREIAYCNSKKSRYQSLASRFAAKEAVFKALGTGWCLGLRWQDVEVVNDSLGKPNIILSGEAQQRAELMGAKKVMVSLSHTKKYAVAYVVLIGDENANPTQKTAEKYLP